MVARFVMKSNKKQIISILAILTMAILLSCALVACDKVDTDKTGTDIVADYKVTIHPNNGQDDIVWDITKEIPTITKEGYHIAGYFLDAQLTISTTLESLKATGITKNIDVYVKWEEDICEHVAVTDAAVEPTCTEKGLTEGKHCSKCGKILTAQTEIDALGHDLENHDGQEATCTEKGWKAYVTCKRKGCGYTTYQEIPALGHTEVVDDAIAPTCTEKGKTEGKHCSVCNEVIIAQTDIAALGHDIEHHDKKDATCTEIGWDEYDTCKREGCGYTTYQEIPALGHKYSQDWSNDKTYHWHASTCGHDVVSDKGKHTFDSNWVCTECAYVDTGLHGIELRTNTLELDGTDIYGKVSNATSTFSFINEIAIADSAKYTVSTDINGLNVIPTKTVSLSIGDNTFYILVENGKDLGLYTVVIRRRPMHSVSFNVNGGTSVSSQTIEEDHFATEPTTERRGYTFDKWDYDFSKPIIKDTTITASWNIITYNVYYDLNVPSDSISQDVDNSMNVTTYTVEDAITFQTPSRKGYRFIGWDKNIEKGTIGDVTVTASWEVIEYDIVYDFGDVDSVSKATNNTQNPSKYTIENTITFAEPSRTGYTFVAWNKNIVRGTIDTQTIVASWIAEQHTINYVLSNGWTNSENNITTYTIEDQTITLYDAIDGESLFCGWYLDEECKNHIATIDASTMRDYTVYAYADDSATKGLSIENGRVKGYNGTSTDVVIPSYYKGCNVTSIGSYAFNDCTSLTSITIPDSVTSIGNYAFEYCSALTSVTLGNSVTSIGKDAFKNCYKLVEVYNKSALSITAGSSDNGGVARYAKNVYTNEGGSKLTTDENGYVIYMDEYEMILVSYRGTNIELVLPSYITKINQNAFSGCSSLTSITIPDSVTSIGDSAFSGCSGLTSITIPDSVTSIGGGAFSGCKGLTSITIPNSVTSIGNWAFSGCSGLTSITIPNSVTSIGAYAFSFCTGLTSIIVDEENTKYHSAGNCLIETESKTLIAGCKNSIIPTDGSVTSIGSSAFRGCTGLTSITIPNSVTSIGEDAFSGCSSLTSITIPDSVTSIDRYAFSGCTGLTNITIPDSVTSIGDRAFYDTTWYNNQPDGLVYAGKVAYKYKGTMPSNTSIVLKEGTLGIADFAFQGCSGFTSITIPDSVTSVGYAAFSGCTGLIKIIGPSDAVSAVAKQCNSKAIAEIVITSGTSIRDCAFRDCTSLTTVTIPDSVTSIDGSAFSGCTGLTSITIPDSVTSIGFAAFFGCTGLTSVTIGNGVTSIGDNAFWGCNGLTSITIPDSVTSIGSSAFYNCTGLTSISGSATNVGTVAKQAKPTSFTVNITSGTSIGDRAFSGCTGLTSVTMGNSVTSIRGGAFSGCTGLTSITIPDSVTHIDDYAFEDCTGLTSITIPDSVTSIGTAAFYNTAWYNNQPDGLVYVGKVAYKYKGTMPSNTSIVLEEGTLSITDHAFEDCTGLTSVTIPDSVTSIGSFAFSGCAGLTSITFNGTIAQWNAIYKGYDWKLNVPATQVVCTDGTTSI